MPSWCSKRFKLSTMVRHGRSRSQTAKKRVVGAFLILVIRPVWPSRTTVLRLAKKGKRSKQARFCLYGPCKASNEQRNICECPRASETEKQKMFDTIAASKARTGPSKWTRSQVKLENEKHPSSTSKITGTTGRLVKSTDPDSPAMNITISNGVSLMSTFGPCDDGSDNSLVSPRIAEAAVLQRIGKFCNISPFHLSVAIKIGSEDAQTFSFCRSWTAPKEYTAPLGRSVVSCECYVNGC